MVVSFDDGVVVRDNDLLVSHQGNDCRSFRQVDLLDLAADDLRLFVGTVSNRLDGLCCATAQRVHLGHVATTDVREQGTDRNLLR